MCSRSGAGSTDWRGNLARQLLTLRGLSFATDRASKPLHAIESILLAAWSHARNEVRWRVSNVFTLDSVRKTLGQDGAKRFAKWIALSILDDCNARLVVSSAGEVARQPLAPIYVDLGIQRAAGDQDASSVPFFEALVSKGDAELARALFGENAENNTEVPRNWVLFGGPGHGKSTLTQWATLAHAWAALSSDKCTTHTKLANLGIERSRATVLVARLKEIGGRLDNAPSIRPPAALAIRIELPSFVEFFASNALQPDFHALTTYLAQKHGGETYASEWATLIRKHQCFFFFDALDEVTTPTTRAACVAMIDATREAGGLNARTIVTSRPQGYDGVLGPDCVNTSHRNADGIASDGYRDGFLQLHVASLSNAQVTEFVSNVLAQQTVFPQRDTALLQSAISSALQRPNTRALLRAPLFVSIMLPLVDKGGSVPSNRTKLLDSLYSILCDRESTKDTTGRLRALLDDYRWALDALHARVALALHVRSQELGARTSVSLEELRSFAETVVGERIDLLKIRTQIVEDLLFFARDRLVLLAQHEADTVRFDVRLVQEYFASKALFEPSVAPELRMTPALRAERLRAIATDSYWQQVLAFAVDNFAANNDREMFEVLAKTLVAASVGDSQIAPRVMQVARRGEQVARALIESGALSSAPNERARFWAIATSGAIHDWPGTAWSYASAASALGADQPELIEHLVSLCEQEWRERREFVALRMLEALSIVQENERARSIVDAALEKDAKARQLIVHFDRRPPDDVAISVTQQALQRASAIDKKFPHDFDPLDFDDPWRDEPRSEIRNRWAKIRRENRRFGKYIADGGRAFQFLAIGAPGPWLQLRDAIPVSDPQWRELSYVAEFCAEPSPSTFSSAVRRLLDVLSPMDERLRYLPWMISAVLHRVRRGERKDDVLAAIESGELGTAPIWRSVESAALIRPNDLWRYDGVSALLLEGPTHYTTNAGDRWAADLWSREGQQLRAKLDERSRFAASLLAWSVRVVDPDNLAFSPCDPELVQWMLTVGALSEATLPLVLPEPEAAAPFLASLQTRVADQLLNLRGIAPTTVHGGWITRSLQWFLGAAKTHSDATVTAALATLASNYNFTASASSLVPALEALPCVSGAEFAWARIQLIASRQDQPSIRDALDILAQRNELAAKHRKAIARRWTRDAGVTTSHRIALALRLWDEPFEGVVMERELAA